MICYIHGSFMNDNFGDYLLYDSTVTTCAEVINAKNLIACNIDKSYDCRSIVNRRSKWNALKTADVAILTGGGYFGEINKKLYKHYWNLRFIFRHGLPLLYLAMTHKKYIIVGLGVGPLSWGITRKIASYILKTADKVILRDKESLDYALNDLGITREIDVYPDIVMGCDVKKFLIEDQWAKDELLNTKHHIALHLTTKNRHNGKGIDIVLSDVKKFAAEHGCEWGYYIIYDQSGRNRIKRAKEICETLINMNLNAKIIPYQGPEKMCSLINQMDIILTDKLHVGIVGTKLGKYVISAASHQKTQRFYNQMGRADYTIRLENLKQGQIYKLLNMYTTTLNLNDITEFEEQSKNNLLGIKKFLRDNMSNGE